MTAEAFPLTWPAGWPRTPDHKKQDSKYRFARGDWRQSGGRRFWSFGEARDKLFEELARMGASGITLSSNYSLRNDGLPRADRRAPEDAGIAVYFTLNGKQMVMACDMHIRAEENMRSITLALEAMRQLERHGGGIMMEKAFAGFEALPAPGQRPPWWTVLGVEESASRSDVDAAYRRKARERHPDAGGSDTLMAELNAARDEALRATERAA